MDLWKLNEMKIKEAIRKGELKNLPGEGKPLKLENPNPLESKEQRLFSKVLKNFDLLPDEVPLLKEIENIEQKLKDCKVDSEKENLKLKLKELKLKYDIQMEARRSFFNK